jgi:hypothetical protein
MASPTPLPVSGFRVFLREPTGDDELIALRRDPPAAVSMLALARALVRAPDGSELDWPALPAVDLAAAALLIRSAWLGDRISTETLCPADGCGAQIDVSFLIGDYLDHHRPRAFRGAAPAADGWFALAGSEAEFRIPTIAEQVTAVRDGLDGDWLGELCIRPADVPASVRRRIERALSTLAPQLEDHVGGQCPVCGHTVELFFAPLSYVLAELRDTSSGLYADVHELAFAYGWSEASILALDRRRRHGYVAMIRGELALA